VEGNVYVGNGNIGIGSSVPTQKLDVQGSGYFNGNIGIGTSAPGAWLEVGAGGQSYFRDTVYMDETDNGNSGAAKTIDWRTSNKQEVTITASCTFTFTAPSGKANLVLKAVHENSATAYAATWPGTVMWPGGVKPGLTNAANAVDVISCYYDGTNYYCQAGLNFSP
jgi:hypothetical protein